MIPNRRRIEEIVIFALELENAERSAYLDVACANDASLRREVESLLAQNSAAQAFLETPILEAAARAMAETSSEFRHGQLIGPYRIDALIGAGGMGEVYRATDTRLHRTVAIKVLPPERVSDPERKRRFLQEARAASSLNHPNIVTVHDIATDNGIDHIVMEYVQGQSLDKLIKPKGLPVGEALGYTQQIAGALAVAHSAGIVHRDIKPANVIVTPESQVKVLDFGLAKLVERPSDSVTAWSNTKAGTIMGTVAYMSPEQASGRECDHRTDIFSLGIVLFEMLTGARPFRGKSEAETMAAIINDPAPPLEQPYELQNIVDKALAKDPKDRYQHSDDLALDLRRFQQRPAVPVITRRRGRERLAWALLGVLGIVALAVSTFRFPASTPGVRPVRFSVAPPEKAPFFGEALAISPDGTRVAFAASTAGSEPSIWIRRLDSFNSEPLPGTEGASLGAFWSPDSRFLGFVAGGKLKKVDAGGTQSSVQSICPTAVDALGAWNRDGIILFQPELSGSGLYRVSAAGGVPEPVTRLNPARREISHRYPQFLPDGRHFLYFVWSASEEYSGIYVGSVEANEKLKGPAPLVRTWRRGEYVAGFLMFLQGTTLVAQRFDTGKLRLMGEPQGLPERVATSFDWTGGAMFSLSSSGSLAYQEVTPSVSWRALWVDRSGKETREIEIPRGSLEPALSPDVRWLAVSAKSEFTIEDIWTINLERSALMRLTASAASSMTPIWSPEGRQIAFRSNRNGAYDLYLKDVGGSNEELIVKSEHRKAPVAWSPDGRFLVFEQLDPRTKWDLWIVPLQGDRKPFPFLNTEFNELSVKFSPVPDTQGRFWVVYRSDETGQFEIYLRPFTTDAPGGASGGPKVRVSTGGGMLPRWRKDARELFYVANGKLMAVDVKLGATAEIGMEHPLFDLPARANYGYQPFGDGSRFIFTRPPEAPTSPKVNVVLNWMAELKQ